LADGAKTLADGAGTLASGTATLKQGTTDLKDGGVTLSDGVSQLLSGAAELMDGMAQFDEEGIQELSSIFQDDAQELIDRVRAVQALGREYTSFTGDPDGADSSVRFILRTDSIGE
jgi:putative membrane protein